MKTLKKIKISHIVYLIFMALHSVICFMTTYFGDDYYYAGFLRGGKEYFISENILHYKITNGRAFVHFLDELLIGFGALPWRIFCIACVGILVILLAKLASRSYMPDIKDRPNDFGYALIAVCALFSIIDLSILVQSVYWMTGSLNYIFPVTLTVLVYYLFRRDLEHGSSARSYLLIIPAFLAGLTTEQASVSAILAIACMIVYQIMVRRKKPHLSHLLSLAAALASASTLFLAPGNSIRTEYYPDFYALSVFGRFRHNLRELGIIVLGSHGMHTIFACGIAVLTVLLLRRTYLLTKKENGHGRKFAAKTLFYMGSTVLCGAILVTYLQLVKLAGTGADISVSKLSLLIIVIPVFGVLAASAVRFFSRGEADDLFFLWGAVSMQLAMSISPQFGPRTVMISAIMLIVPIARRAVSLRSSVFGALLYASAASVILYILCKPEGPIFAAIIFIIAAAIPLFAKATGGSRSRIIKSLVCGSAAAAVVLSLRQFDTVAEGFAENRPVHAANEKQLASYTGEGPLVLYYLKNNTHKYTMPYDDPYHQAKLLILAGLPAETEVIYVEYPEG